MSSTRLPVLLDTHTWVWVVNGDEHVSAKARSLVDRAAQQGAVLVSAISVWEVGMLESKRRLRLGKDTLAWVLEALARPGVTLAPLTPEIAVASTRLPGGLGGDPADRILVATARAHAATLVTRDDAILAYARAGHVSALPT